MHVFSLRGPGQDGGVSSGIANYRPATWFHFEDNQLVVLRMECGTKRVLGSFNRDQVAGAYDHANRWGWLGLHGLWDVAQYMPALASDFRAVNDGAAVLIHDYLNREHPGDKRRLFVQDYQLCLVPRELRRLGRRAWHFMHVPFPNPDCIPESQIPHMVRWVKSMLATDLVGFHTDGYADNFLVFVERNITKVHQVDRDNMMVRRLSTSKHGPHATRIGRAPLGIDVPRWEQMATTVERPINMPFFLGNGEGQTPYVVSVDRTDPAKNVLTRLRAIDCLFTSHPELVGKLTFLFVCGPTRTQIPQYARYWEECRHEEAALQEKWRTGVWTPVVWQDKYPQEQLAYIYRHAEGIWASAYADGLNLTLLEFAMAQLKGKSGCVFLPSEVGAASVLGEDGGFFVDPHSPAAMAETVYRGLFCTTQQEKEERLERMRLRIGLCPLQTWTNRLEASTRRTRARVEAPEGGE
jgi:trehalose 6-phosphate synthase